MLLFRAASYSLFAIGSLERQRQALGGPAGFHEFIQQVCSLMSGFIILAKFIWQTGIGISGNKYVRLLRKLLQVRTHFFSA